MSKYLNCVTVGIEKCDYNNITFASQRCQKHKCATEIVDGKTETFVIYDLFENYLLHCPVVRCVKNRSQTPKAIIKHGNGLRNIKLPIKLIKLGNNHYMSEGLLIKCVWWVLNEPCSLPYVWHQNIAKNHLHSYKSKYKTEAATFTNDEELMQHISKNIIGIHFLRMIRCDIFYNVIYPTLQKMIKLWITIAKAVFKIDQTFRCGSMIADTNKNIRQYSQNKTKTVDNEISKIMLGMWTCMNSFEICLAVWPSKKASECHHNIIVELIDLLHQILKHSNYPIKHVMVVSDGLTSNKNLCIKLLTNLLTQIEHGKLSQIKYDILELLYDSIVKLFGYTTNQYVKCCARINFLLYWYIFLGE